MLVAVATPTAAPTRVNAIAKRGSVAKNVTNAQRVITACPPTAANVSIHGIISYNKI